MPLISCPDCGAQVSDRAPSCIKCGAPIAQAMEVAQIGTPLTTTQETSKALKVHIAISMAFFIVSMLTLCSSLNQETVSESDVTQSVLALFGIMASAIWYLATKIRIWWHHK